jgi:hypothetical protein
MPYYAAVQYPPNHATCSHVMSLLPLVVVCLVALTKIVPSRYHNDSSPVRLMWESSSLYRRVHPCSDYCHCWMCVLLPVALPPAKVFLSPHQDPCQTVGSGVVVQLALHKSVLFVSSIYQEQTLARWSFAQ